MIFLKEQMMKIKKNEFRDTYYVKCTTTGGGFIGILFIFYDHHLHRKWFWVRKQKGQALKRPDLFVFIASYITTDTGISLATVYCNLSLLQFKLFNNR